jgi:phage-related protein
MSTPITFVPPVGPSQSTTQSRTPKIYLAEYGDGYEQRAAAGINTRRLSASVVWDGLVHTDANQIVSFFEARAGFEPFLYMLLPDTVTRRWVCSTIARSEIGPLGSSLSAEWREVFDI